LPVDAEEAGTVFDSWDESGKGEMSLKDLQSILKRNAATIPSLRKNAEQVQLERQREEARRAEKALRMMKHAVALKIKKPSATQERLLQDLGERYEDNPQRFVSWTTAHNTDGYITRSDFRKLVKMLQITAEKEEMDHFFDLLDVEDEGKISVKRMEASLRWVGKSRRTTLVRGKEMVFRSERQLHERVGDAMRANEERVLELFREWDQDDDGVINRSEFRLALPLLGLIIGSREESDRLFDFFDANKDGSISFEEFHQILRKDESRKAQAGEVIPEDERLCDPAKVRAEIVEMVSTL